MANVFVSYDIQMVALITIEETDSMVGTTEHETAQSYLGRFIDSAESAAAALADLEDKPEVEGVIFTLYGRYADGCARAVFDGSHYQACADIYTAITGRDLAPLACDVFGLAANQPSEPSRTKSRKEEIEAALETFGYRMEHSLDVFDDRGHALVEITSGELVDEPPPVHLLTLAEEWTRLEEWDTAN